MQALYLVCGARRPQLKRIPLGSTRLLVRRSSIIGFAATLLLNAASALFGAWVGARLALERVRRERAFEKRLAWYERFHAELQGVMAALSAIIHTQRRVGLTDTTRDLWAKLAERMLPFGHAATDAEFYAPNKTLAIVRKSVEDVATFRSGLPDREQNPEAWLDHAKLVRDSLRVASVVLAQDVRQHLGLEPIDLDILRAALPPPSRPLE